MPLNTMAMPASSAAAMTSLSLSEPPGWITAVAPASATASKPSGNGKNASEAATEPTVSGSLSPASRAASRSEEHTSELQSQFHLVCPLLPEKKKINKVQLST